MKHQLIAINEKKDIPSQYQGTPIELLIEYHNFHRPFDPYQRAQLLVGMCMDNRECLRLPDNFAYIIRSAGANLRHNEFSVSFAFAIGEIQHAAVICHSDCGMVNVASKKDRFIRGMAKIAGWSEQQGEEHFMSLALIHEIENEIEFAFGEAERLKKKYPKIVVAPLYFRVEDKKLYFIRQKNVL